MFGLLAVAALALSHTAAYPPWDAVTGVSLADVQAFPVPAPVVRANWRLAFSHHGTRRDEVRAWNLAAAAGQWDAECRWRCECWDKLDDVLNCPYPAAQKLRSLARLRALLGDDAYLSGRMPSPIPTYRDR